jgi:hypothetical protein
VQELCWLVAVALAVGAPASAFDWSSARNTSVVEVLTSDPDGDLRETPVWIVVLGDAAYVRTNDTKWLANIRRGSAVRLRINGLEAGVEATEVSDARVAADVEEAFKQKYGLTQRVMSMFRMTEPTVLRLTTLES